MASNVLTSLGSSPRPCGSIPVVSHIAEKLHAYTMPRPRAELTGQETSRTLRFSAAQEPDAETLRAAFTCTFTFRETHLLPQSLPEPPSFWKAPYTAMAETDDLPWRSLAEVHGAAAGLLDPVLGGAVARGKWVPDRWRWRSR